MPWSGWSVARSSLLIQRVGMVMNMNWFLGTCSRRCPQKAAVDGNKTSLTPSMIAIYFTESLIFRLLYVGPSARHVSESPTKQKTYLSQKKSILPTIFNTPSSLSLTSLP
jgi:hypothetical protein